MQSIPSRQQSPESNPAPAPAGRSLGSADRDRFAHPTEGAGAAVAPAQFRPAEEAESTSVPSSIPDSIDEAALGATPPAPPSSAREAAGRLPADRSQTTARPGPAEPSTQFDPGLGQVDASMGEYALPSAGPFPVIDETSLPTRFNHEMRFDQGTLVYSSSDWFRRGYWYSQHDVVLMLRTETQNVHIGADNATAGSSLLTSKSADPSFEPGARLTLGRFLGQDVSNRDHTVEVTFLGLFEYSETASLQAVDSTSLQTALAPGALFISTADPNGATFTGVSGLVIGTEVDGFSDALRYDLRYDSDFNSFETNYRIFTRPFRDRRALQPNGQWVRHATPSRLKSLLIGLRTISINELMRFQASYTDQLTQGTYQVQTENGALGLQLGGELFENYTTWSWGARFKVGAFYNWAGRRSKFHTQVVDTDGLIDETLLTEETHGGNLMPLIEVSVAGSYQVRPNLMLRAAYDVMYLTGIATAPENAGLEANFPNFEVGHDALFHGVSAGVEMLW